MFVLIFALFVSIGIGVLIVFALLYFNGRMEQREMVTRRLVEIEGRQMSHAAEKRLAIFDRLLEPNQRNRLSRKLAEAGWYRVTPAMMGMRMAFGAGAGLAIGLFFLRFVHLAPPIVVTCCCVLVLMGAFAPIVTLNRAITARKDSVALELPSFLDLVGTSVQAGTALNQAIAMCVDAVHGALAEEVQAALADIRMGRSRAEALTAMSHRLNQSDLSGMVTAIVQAERLGGDISKVLYDLSVEARERRMARAEQIAGSLPVKMALPMVFFMLPALFIMIFGAVALQLIGGHTRGQN